MKAKDFLDKKFNGRGYECKVYNWSVSEIECHNLPDLLEEYAQLNISNNNNNNMETKAEFAVKILKQYADENQITPRSTSDLSNLEGWLLARLYESNPKSDLTNIPTQTNDIKEEKQLRYFVDVRSGCAAIRDREHEKYDATYPGLHEDTPDVVKYRHGYIADDNWVVYDDDIDYLNDLCDKLNNSLVKN